jgi:hypothetical protein
VRRRRGSRSGPRPGRPSHRVCRPWPLDRASRLTF